MTRAMAAAIALTLAGAPAAALAGEAKTSPCQQTQDSPVAKPAAPAGAVAGIERPAPQLVTPRTGAAPRNLAPELLPQARTGTTDRAYVLDRETGAIIFGDGQSGRTLPSGGGNITATYRSGAGSAGEVDADPCICPRCRDEE